MKHAGPQALADAAPLLDRIRRFEGLTEKRTGTFYRRSRAFLHFHEDPAGLFADLRTTDRFERFRVTTAEEQDSFVGVIAGLLDSPMRDGRAGPP